jgi:hypothetical protein
VVKSSPRLLEANLGGLFRIISADGEPVPPTAADSCSVSARNKPPAWRLTLQVMPEKNNVQIVVA